MLYITKRKKSKGQKEKETTPGNLRRTQLLDTQPRKPLAHINGRIEALALDEPGDEAAGEGITGAVRVVDLGSVDGVDGELLDVGRVLGGDDGGARALRDDDDAGPLGVGLGQVGDGARDGLDVRRVGQVVRLRVRLGLRLVADHVVPVRRRGVERVLEELRYEGRREVHHEDLVVRGRFLAEGLDGRWADCGVVSKGTEKKRKRSQGKVR